MMLKFSTTLLKHGTWSIDQAQCAVLAQCNTICYTNIVHCTTVVIRCACLLERNPTERKRSKPTATKSKQTAPRPKTKTKPQPITTTITSRSVYKSIIFGLSKTIVVTIDRHKYEWYAHEKVQVITRYPYSERKLNRSTQKHQQNQKQSLISPIYIH